MRGFGLASTMRSRAPASEKGDLSVSGIRADGARMSNQAKEVAERNSHGIRWDCELIDQDENREV